MKNYAILGLTALLMFSVSAGLSLWLQQSKPTEEVADAKKKKKGPADDHGADGKTPPGDDHGKGAKGDPDVLGMAGRTAGVKAEQDEKLLETRLRRIELVLADMRAERDALDNLTKQVMAEMKLVQTALADSGAKAAEADKVQQATAKTAADADSADRKNIERLAVIYESMPPENAASLLRQSADGGKLDLAVKVLAGMKETKAAKVLVELEKLDAGLAAQLLEKMRTSKRPMVPTGTGAGG